jgi:pimeloyl-ACP methyl ester carboxylesterase
MASLDTKILLIPGMTAEYPVFSRLAPLLPAARIISFVAPQRAESLRSYARRMASGLSGDCFLVGVSFGGIVALEMAQFVQPRGCVLISSVRGPHQLPPWFRALRFIGARRYERVLRLLGKAAELAPDRLRTASTLRATKLAGDKGAWHRWATASVLDWQPESESSLCPVWQIHGDADTTFPIRYVEPDVVIRGGPHTLPISHPKETATAIRSFISGDPA